MSYEPNNDKCLKMSLVIHSLIQNSFEKVDYPGYFEYTLWQGPRDYVKAIFFLFNVNIVWKKNPAGMHFFSDSIIHYGWIPTYFLSLAPIIHVMLQQLCPLLVDFSWTGHRFRSPHLWMSDMKRTLCLMGFLILMVYHLFYLFIYLCALTNVLLWMLHSILCNGCVPRYRNFPVWANGAGKCCSWEITFLVLHDMSINAIR